MKTREERIQFEMNYCQHYGRGKGADMVCNAGMDLKTVQCVPTGGSSIHWGPCIEGHKLDNPKQYCPHWVRRTREQGEKRADSIERSLAIVEKVMPFVSKWKSKPPRGKSEVVACPACGGKLNLIQSAYNGHARVLCETNDCADWME